MTAAQSHRDRLTPNNARAGHRWAATVVFDGMLLLLIFVLRNGWRVDGSYPGADGQPPLGVALLLAAIFGVLLVALPARSASCSYGCAAAVATARSQPAG